MIQQSTHINFGGLGESPDWVNVVVKDDDPYHHSHAEQHGVCVGEPAAVLPEGQTVTEESGYLSFVFCFLTVRPRSMMGQRIKVTTR